MKSTSGEIRVTEAQNGASVTLAIDDRLVFSLPETPTTGYRWQLESSGSESFALVDDVYTPDSMQPGAAGTRVITLRAAKPFHGKVQLRLSRAWEAEEALRTMSIEVNSR